MKSLWKKFKYIIKVKEVLLGIIVLVFAILGFIYEYNVQKEKEGKIPLVFSEVGQVKRNYAKMNQQVPSTTLYYGVVNDIAMKVFEANNEAITRNGFSDRAFAQELEFKMDPTFKYHHRIYDYAKEFPLIQQRIKEDLKIVYLASEDLVSMIHIFKNIWDENHEDVYHTECYTVTVTDSNGNTHIETRSREVYDYTIHTYTYHSNYGEQAEKLLSDFTTKYLELKIERLAPIIKETGAENEDAIDRTTEKSNNKSIITSYEAKKIVLKNYKDSNLEQNREKISSFNTKLINQSLLWQRDRKIARSCLYQTYSHSDDGPKAYQTSELILVNERRLLSYIDDIIDPMSKSNLEIQKLNSDIIKFISIALDGKKGDSSEIRNDIMENAKCLYKENFNAGMNIETFNIGVVILFIIAGMSIGAGVGYLLLFVFLKNSEIFYSAGDNWNEY